MIFRILLQPVESLLHELVVPVYGQECDAVQILLRIHHKYLSWGFPALPTQAPPAPAPPNPFGSYWGEIYSTNINGESHNTKNMYRHFNQSEHFCQSAGQGEKTGHYYAKRGNDGILLY
jgi:hypothetical protein